MCPHRICNDIKDRSYTNSVSCLRTRDEIQYARWTDKVKMISDEKAAVERRKERGGGGDEEVGAREKSDAVKHSAQGA